MKTFNQFLAEMAGGTNKLPLIGTEDDAALATGNSLGARMAQAQAARRAAAQAQPAQAAAAPNAKAAGVQRGQAADAELPDVFNTVKAGSINPAQLQPAKPTGPEAQLKSKLVLDLSRHYNIPAKQLAQRVREVDLPSLRAKLGDQTVDDMIRTGLLKQTGDFTRINADALYEFSRFNPESV